LAKIYKFGLADRHVGQWTLPQYRNVIVQQPLVSGVTVGGDILNKFFDSNIALIASSVTAADNSSSYELTRIPF